MSDSRSAPAAFSPADTVGREARPSGGTPTPAPTGGSREPAAFGRRELAHGRLVILERWPFAYRHELGVLPRPELELLLELAGLLDAEPVDPVTLRPLVEAELTRGPIPPRQGSAPPPEWHELGRTLGALPTETADATREPPR